MGRVHKKKIAEYAEAENNKEIAANNESERKKAANVSSSNSTPELELDEVETNKTDNGKRATKRKTESDETESEADGSSVKNARKSGKAKQSKNKSESSRVKEKSVKETAKEEDSEEYEVQKIVDHKVENGESLYLVRWKGYTEEDDTWEPEATLSCPDLIAKFNKKQNGAESNSPKKQNTKTSKKGRKSGTQQKEADATKEYEVDKIINYAQEKGGRVFLIRWKGYGAKHDTWEPEENLNCNEIIEKFMQKMRQQENASFKELREEPKKTKRLVNEMTRRPTYTKSANSRASKRNLKKRVYYGDSDN